MFLLLCLLGAVVWLGETFGETAGAIGMAALIVFIVVIAIQADSKESRAHANWVDYWARGGPEQYRKNGKRDNR